MEPPKLELIAWQFSDGQYHDDPEKYAHVKRATPYSKPMWLYLTLQVRLPRWRNTFRLILLIRSLPNG